ncbi:MULTISPECIES: hypothetical protein [unclassified Nocardia]|uniref:hypothetical protein n=1 Tax=unclassified Nocardia TaxID=2637762 RepID=UPI001CE4B152|nr:MULTISPECIES: hypothetical protein [unclassified Nocardia]
MPVLLANASDPFGDGQHWTIVAEVRDETGQPVRILYQCRYVVESGHGRAWVTERRWDDGRYESRDVTLIE